MTAPLNRRFCVAPMIDWSDRHARYLWRLMSDQALLYTEMITTGAILRGHAERWLAFNQEEHPVALQLGGSDPRDLSRCTQLGEQWGYDEINLNCGCPSDRVQSGTFGACLMAEPERVADCLQAMIASVSIPVTVKHRIGIDHQDEYSDLTRFVSTLAQAGCKTFIVHARKAWLEGLSPKQNREIPPLLYHRVYQLKNEFPQLEIVINGGIASLAGAEQHLQHVDGVMMGREAYQNPYVLADVDRQFFSDTHPVKTRGQVLDEYLHYCERELAAGRPLHHLTRPLLGLYHSQRGGKIFRRIISEKATRKGAGTKVIAEAAKAISDVRSL